MRRINADEARKISIKKAEKKGFFYELKHKIAIERILRHIRRTAKRGDFELEFYMKGYSAVEIYQVKKSLIEKGYRVEIGKSAIKNFLGSEYTEEYPKLSINWYLK